MAVEDVKGVDHHCGDCWATAQERSAAHRLPRCKVAMLRRVTWSSIRGSLQLDGDVHWVVDGCETLAKNRYVPLTKVPVGSSQAEANQRLGHPLR